MQHLYLQLSVLVLALLIASIKSIRMQKEDFVAAVPEAADPHEKNLEALLRLQRVLQSNLLILNIFLLSFLASTVYGLFQAIALAFFWLVIVHLLAAAKRVQKPAEKFARKNIRALIRLAIGLQPALSLLDNSRFIITKRQNSYNSKAELIEAINRSKGVLSKGEKKQLQAILTESVVTPIEQPAAQSAAEITLAQ